MFAPDRWAAAFAAVLTDRAAGPGEGLAVLRALAPPLLSIPGKPSGLASAKKIDRLIQKAAGSGKDACFEVSSRFISLLVQRGHLVELDRIIAALETYIDQQQGILSAALECASDADASFQQEIEAALKKKTQAAGVRLKTEKRPELLGGFRLRTAGFVVDASLRGALENLALDIGGRVSLPSS